MRTGYAGSRVGLEVWWSLDLILVVAYVGLGRLKGTKNLHCICVGRSDRICPVIFDQVCYCGMLPMAMFLAWLLLCYLGSSVTVPVCS